MNSMDEKKINTKSLFMNNFTPYNMLCVYFVVPLTQSHKKKMTQHTWDKYY